MKVTHIILIILLSEYIYSKDIIIIGAGVAGLNAANSLKGENTVTVLEGRSRAGGRVWSDNTLGYPMDLGAAWIHGINGNEVYNLAKSNNVNTVIFNYDNINYYSSTLSSSELVDANDKMTSASRGFFAYLESFRSSSTSDDSLFNVYQNYIKSKNLDKASLTYLNNFIFSELEVEFGSKIENLSAQNYDSSGAMKGDDVLMPSGYFTIFEPLLKDLTVKYNTTVKSITRSDRITVTTQAGETLIADYVIVTVPLGCLKANTIKFYPELSDEKKNAIEKLSFGTIEKIVLEFSEKFWDDYSLQRIINNPITPFNWFVNFHKVSGKNTLIFLIGGDGKYFDLINTTKTEIEMAVVNVLKTVYPRKTINVVKSIVTNWKNDPFALGAYTSYGVGADSKLVDEFTRREGNIFFAGEHTDKTNLQTVKGAYLSGKRVADQIMNGEIHLKISFIILFIFAVLFI